MNAGYLYIITNPQFSGWLKIGITENLNKRLQVYQTASPFRDYKLEYSIYHPNYKIAEKIIDINIKPFAKQIRNEWYQIDLQMAISRLDEVLENYSESSLPSQFSVL